LGNLTDIDALKGQLKGKADTFPYGSEKNKKVTKTQSAPTASKLNLVALKPLLKTPETQTSSPSSVEPSLAS
jgi:hypothetical protein